METSLRVTLCLTALVLCIRVFAADEVFVTGENGSGNYKTYAFTSTGTFVNETAPPSSLVTTITTSGVNALVGNYGALKILTHNTSNVNVGTFATISAASMGTGGVIAVNKIEVDAAGSVYICPTGFSSNPRTSLRYTSGAVLSQSFTHANLVFPSGIDADASGNVYIVNSAAVGVGDVIFKFQSNGTFLGTTDINSLGINPSDLAIDEASNVLYLSNESGGTSAIRKFNIAGALPVHVGTISTPGLSGAVGLSFDPSTGNLLATAFNGSTVEVTSAGSSVHTYAGGTLGSGRDIVRIASQSPPVPVELSIFSVE
ncbi:MAG: hypothetical protein AMXMBFR84_33740 [Candidatus Hydrogenedentota bacterium]